MDNQTLQSLGQNLALEITALSIKCAAYIAGGTLDRNGKPLPVSLDKPKRKRRKRRPSRSSNEAAMARRSILGLFENTIASGLSSDAHITGHTAPHFRLTAAQIKEGEWGEPDIDFCEQRGDVLTRRTNLAVPIRRYRKIASRKGETTFHLRIYSISKTSADARPSTTLKRAGSHSVYIAREGALASDGLAPELIPKGDAYVTRSDVIPVSIGERQLLYTNISYDPREREEFWEAVVEHERTPGPESMYVDLSRCRPLLRLIASAPDCPAKFVEEFAKIEAKPGVCKLKTGSNDTIKEILKRMGETMPPEVGWKDGKRLTNQDRLKDHGFAFLTPRGGRVQMRIEAELPHELLLESKEAVLERMCSILDRQGLPYIGVIHRPDHNNHEKNWHIHILFYDRPVERFTGEASDLLMRLPSGASKETPELHAKLQESAEKITASRSNRQGWDFELEEHFRTDCGHKRMRYPFEQPKDRTVNSKAFVKSMRKAFSDLCNEELEKAQSGRRLHPGSFADLGITKRPDVKLSSNAQRLEKFGVPTRQGVENERNQFAYNLATFAQRRKTSLDNLKTRIEGWSQGARRGLSLNGDARFAETQKLYEGAARRLADKVLLASIFADFLDRSSSRASETIANAEKAIAAINKNPQIAKAGEEALLRKRLRQASGHLIATDALFRPEFDRLMQLEAEIRLDRSLVDELGPKLGHAEVIEQSLEGLLAASKNARKNFPEAASRIAAEMNKIDMRVLADFGQLKVAHEAVDNIAYMAASERARRVVGSPAVTLIDHQSTTGAFDVLSDAKTEPSQARRLANAEAADDEFRPKNVAADNVENQRRISSEDGVGSSGGATASSARRAVKTELGESAENVNTPSLSLDNESAGASRLREDKNSSESLASESAASAPATISHSIESDVDEALESTRTHQSTNPWRKSENAVGVDAFKEHPQTEADSASKKEIRKSADAAKPTRVADNPDRSSEKRGADSKELTNDAERPRRDLMSAMASLEERLAKERAQKATSNTMPDSDNAATVRPKSEASPYDASPQTSAPQTLSSAGTHSAEPSPSIHNDKSGSIGLSEKGFREEDDTPTIPHVHSVENEAGRKEAATHPFEDWWELSLPELRPHFKNIPGLERMADAISRDDGRLVAITAISLHDDWTTLQSIQAIAPQLAKILKEIADQRSLLRNVERNNSKLSLDSFPAFAVQTVQSLTSSQAPANEPLTGENFIEEEWVRIANKKLRPDELPFLARRNGMHPAIDLWIEADARKDREAAKAAMRAVLEDSQASAEASRFLPHHREALAEAIHDASAPPEPLRPALAPTRPSIDPRLLERGRDITSESEGEI